MNREYPTRPIVGIGVVLLRPGGLLLIRRGRPPAEGSWSLPGGGQKLGETAEEAARRELREETGLEVGAMLLAGHADSITRDPEGRIRFHYTIIDFAAAWTGGVAKPGGDAMEARWIDLAAVNDYLVWNQARHVVASARTLLNY